MMKRMRATDACCKTVTKTKFSQCLTIFSEFFDVNDYGTIDPIDLQLLNGSNYHINIDSE